MAKEIEKNNNVEIISLRKFDSSKTQGKYLFITLASVEQSKCVTDKGSINIYDKQFTAEKARPQKYKPKSN